jgi:predicted ribosome quality control (RQC) complex YloA/Tae2 family protein
VAVKSVPDERILSFEFSTRDDLGADRSYSLIAQMTGRSANLFLLDENRVILETSREPFGEGQMTGDMYSPPIRSGEKRAAADEKIPVFDDQGTLSSFAENRRKKQLSF